MVQDSFKNIIEAKNNHKFKYINKVRKNKDNFKRNLILRVLSKPEEIKLKGIELSRRVIQLILISYRITFTKQILEGIVSFHCSSNVRKNIINIEKILINSGIPQDKFIYFCYWYLKIFPAGGIFKALKWIYNDSIFSMEKYLANDRDLFNTVYNFTKEKEQGIKLIKTVKCSEYDKTDNVFKKITNL